MSPQTKKLGLIGAIFLIVSSLAGSGVIALPQQLAFTGSITLLSFLLVSLGALFITLIYVRAGSRFTDSSPTALASYVNPVLGAKSGLFYVYGNLVSNVSILIAGLGYLEMFIPALDHPLVLGITIISLIWLFVFLSMHGVGIITQVVSLTVSLLLVGVIFTAIAGWLDFDTAQFVSNWNVSGKPPAAAVMAGFALLTFSFVGVESVATNCALVENPQRNVPLATIIGFIIVAIIYIASTTVVQGMFTDKELQTAPAVFAMAMEKITGSHVLGEAVAGIMAVACIASFLVWNLSSASAARTSAEQGFLPKAYAYTNRYGINSKGLVINGVIMTGVQLLLMSLGSNVAAAFNLTVTISVLLLLFPYFWSGIALLKKNKEEGVRSWKDIGIVLGASVFILAAFASASMAEIWLVLALVLVVMGTYVILLAKTAGK